MYHGVIILLHEQEGSMEECLVETGKFVQG